jgi:sulfopyruvate decarboxylase subunit beta
MLRDDALRALADLRGDALTVATMTTVAPWHALGQATASHIDAMGCMGAASPLGLGLALAQPGRTVLVLDGDGSLLMQLGSLVTIASLAPRNLYHCVFENGRYETTGNQLLPGVGTFDLCQMAQGAGYRQVLSLASTQEMHAVLPRVLATPGPALIRLVLEPESTLQPFPVWVNMADEALAMRQALQARE